MYFAIKMQFHFLTLLIALLPLTVQCVNVVLSNDDGWAEKNIRVFYAALTAAGESVVLSAPAENESGTGKATPVLDTPSKKGISLFIVSRFIRCPCYNPHRRM